RGGDRRNSFAVGQAGNQQIPAAVGGDRRRLAGAAVDADHDAVARLGGAGQRGRAAIEVGGVDVGIVVGPRGRRRVGDRALARRGVDGEAVAGDLRRVAGRVGRGGDRRNSFAVGQAGNQQIPAA